MNINFVSFYECFILFFILFIYFWNKYACQLRNISHLIVNILYLISLIFVIFVQFSLNFV